MGPLPTGVQYTGDGTPPGTPPRKARMPAPTLLVTDLGTSRTLPSGSSGSGPPPGNPEIADDDTEPPSFIPDWDPVEVPLEDMPAPTPHQEDQDRELQSLSPTPHMLHQATAYLEAQAAMHGQVTATDLGADAPPLCKAVATCSIVDTPVNSVAPTPRQWTPFSTPSLSRAVSPMQTPRGSASNHEKEEATQEEFGVMLASGIRRMGNGVVELEPVWYKARSIVWLLGLRRHVQDDSSFLGPGLVVSAWARSGQLGGLGLAQVWFRFGSVMVQDWFMFGLCLVPWLRFGSGVGSG